jgi:glycerol-3-phosphate dehydrogenase
MLARRPSAVYSAVGGECFGGKMDRLSRVCVVMFASQGSVVIGTTDRTAALQDLPTPTLADVNWMLAESNKFLQRQVQRNEVSRITCYASVVLYLSCITCYTSHVTRHTSHFTRHTSRVTRHTSHFTRHTSRVTRHTSHVTRDCGRFLPHGPVCAPWSVIQTLLQVCV